MARSLLSCRHGTGDSFSGAARRTRCPAFFSLLLAIGLALAGFAETSEGGARPPEASASPSALSVELPPSISVRGGPFLLGEYARLEGDLALVARASTARVIPRGQGLLSPRDILDALTEAGCGGVSVRLLCPERVPLMPESSLEERIRAVSAWPFRVQAKVPSGHWILAEGAEIEPGLSVVRIRKAETGQRGVARLVWWGLFPVPDRALPAGSRLPEPVWRVTTFRGAGKLALSSDVVRGRGARGTRSPPEPHPPSALRPEIWLQPGEDVRIRGGRGGVIVEVEGVALESGTSGDWVRVRNRATRAILRGRLVAPGIVEIPSPVREENPTPAPMPDPSGPEMEGGKP